MNSALGTFKILRKDTNFAEIAAGGLAAGMVVEFAVALLSYPFDTIKTRLQASPKNALVKYPNFNRLYDGFWPVALTVPLLAVFWATRDVVRTGIIGVVQQAVPYEVLDTLATGIGAILGESIYWLLKTPGEVLSTQKQAALMEKEEGLEEWELDFITERRRSVPEGWDLFQESLQLWPVLAIADVSYLGLRVTIFTALHDSRLWRQGAVEDELLFVFANVIAVLLTTPLDVVRTQMVLRNSTFQEFPSVAQELYERDGLSAFVAGWTPRLLYNGFIVGLVWGFVRQFYDYIRAGFLVGVLDRLEEVGSQGLVGILSRDVASGLNR